MSEKNIKVGDFEIYPQSRLGDLIRNILLKKLESIYENDKTIMDKRIKESFENIVNTANYRIYGKAVKDHPLYRFFRYDYETLYLFMKKLNKHRLLKGILLFYRLTPMEIWLELEKEYNLNVFNAKIEEEEALNEALKLIKKELKNINTPYDLKWLQQLYEKLQKNLYNKGG